MTQFNERMIFGITTGLDAHIEVNHVYTTEKCRHGNPTFEGVGITIIDTDDDTAAALLHPFEALALANRIVRAANIALEAREDLPDADRELMRYQASHDQESSQNELSQVQ